MIEEVPVGQAGKLIELVNKMSKMIDEISVEPKEDSVSAELTGLIDKETQ